MDKQRPRRKGEKFADPIVGRAWHADATPFDEEDHKRAGLVVPTPEELALCLEANRVLAHGNHPTE